MATLLADSLAAALAGIFDDEPLQQLAPVIDAIPEQKRAVETVVTTNVAHLEPLAEPTTSEPRRRGRYSRFRRGFNPNWRNVEAIEVLVNGGMIEIRFPKKPTETTRERIKQRTGWRFKDGCWQLPNTEANLAFAKSLQN